MATFRHEATLKWGEGDNGNLPDFYAMPVVVVIHFALSPHAPLLAADNDQLQLARCTNNRVRLLA